MHHTIGAFMHQSRLQVPEITLRRARHARCIVWRRRGGTNAAPHWRLHMTWTLRLWTWDAADGIGEYHAVKRGTLAECEQAKRFFGCGIIRPA